MENRHGGIRYRAWGWGGEGGTSATAITLQNTAIKFLKTSISSALCKMSIVSNAVRVFQVQSGCFKCSPVVSSAVWLFQVVRSGRGGGLGSGR